MTGQILFANNAIASIINPITTGATTINLASGTGALFPNPGTGQHFSITLINPSQTTANEIVWCTARSGDRLTVARAQEGTIPAAWNAGTLAANAWSAGQAAAMTQAYSLPVNVLSFGADVSGVMDSTAAINAAIAAATAGAIASGSFTSAVYFPAGKYRVTSTITVNLGNQNISFFGDGPGVSQIIRSTDYGDTFALTTCPQMTMHDLGIVMTTEMTNGAHLNLNGVFQGFFHDLWVTEGFVNFRLVGCAGCKFENIQAGGAQFFSDAVYKANSAIFKLESAASGADNNGIIVSNVSFDVTSLTPATGSKYQYCVWMQACDEFWLSNAHLSGGHIAHLAIAPVQGHPCDGLKAENVWCDFYALNCLTILQGGTQPITDITFTGCTFQGSTQDAVNINSPFLVGCSFSSCTFELNTLSGGIVGAGSNISFDGCQWLNNNGGATHGSTLIIANAASANVTITGGSMSAGPNTDYNLNLSSAPSHVCVTGLAFVGSPAVDDMIITNPIGANVVVAACMPSSGQYNHVIASAASIRIPSVGNMFSISGTTNISAVMNGWPGRQITLIFQGALTLTNASTMSLAGGTFATAINSTLSLISVDGVFWFETGRKV